MQTTRTPASRSTRHSSLEALLLASSWFTVRRAGLAAITFCLLALGAASAQAGTVRVIVEAKGDDPPGGVQLALSDHEGSGGASEGEPEEIAVPLSDGLGQWTLEVPERPPRSLGPVAVIEAKAPGFWSRPQDVVPPVDRPLRVKLWPAATLAAKLRGPRGESTPQEVSVMLREPAASPEEPRQPDAARLVCPVIDATLGECALPAGRWHLRVQARGCVPHYWWDFSVSAGETLELGELTLERGSAVLGRLVTEVGPADPATARVELRPLLDRGILGDDEERRIAQLATAVPINDWGYFHLDGVPPGTYELLARQPGFSDLLIRDVEVSRGSLTELAEPLVLTKSRRMSVAVRPAKQPDGSSWNIHLYENARLSRRERIAAGRTDEQGVWNSSPLRVGPYIVQVRGSGRSSMAWQEVDLVNELQRVVIDLDLVRVKGHLLLGDEPLAGRLWFGGRFAGVRHRTEADDEGAFQLTLPREGTWRVDVVNEAADIRAKKLEVDVATRADSSTAEVEIELPDTLLEGEVVDQEGAPVPGAEVILLASPEKHFRLLTTSDGEGSFAFRGQLPGPYTVEARADGRSSRHQRVDISEAEHQPSVRLVLQEKRQVRGRVVSPSGPVPRAQVLAYAIAPNRSLASTDISSARTDVEGLFDLDVPGGTAHLRLYVLAPGHTLFLRTFALDGGAGEPSLTVEMNPQAGSLEVGAVDSGGGSSPSRLPVVFIDGVGTELWVLKRWAKLNGSEVGEDRETLTIPAMPPGEYAYCKVTGQELFAVLPGAAAPKESACSRGVLTTRGTLHLP